MDLICEGGTPNPTTATPSKIPTQPTFQSPTTEPTDTPSLPTMHPTQPTLTPTHLPTLTLLPTCDTQDCGDPDFCVYVPAKYNKCYLDKRYCINPS